MASASHAMALRATLDCARARHKIPPIGRMARTGHAKGGLDLDGQTPVVPALPRVSQSPKLLMSESGPGPPSDGSATGLKPPPHPGVS